MAGNATSRQNSTAEQAAQIAQTSKMLSFAKEALIASTQLAKDEFGIQNATPTKSDEEIGVDKKYNTPEYRDVFYSVNDSALINQALDYFKQGKRMKKVSPALAPMRKVQTIRKPILQLHSIMYNNPSSWTVFTNIDKFTYTKPTGDSVSITGISNSEVEFIMPIKENMRDAVRTMNKNVLDYKDRVSVQNRNLVVRLHMGECIFADELKIVTKCTTAVDDFEKQVDI